MFLHFLTNEDEKEAFLSFAYIIAVAENEDSSDNIPIRAKTDNPEEGEYEFEEFTPGFTMQTSELLMLRKFAQEMGVTWDPVSSYSSSGESPAEELKDMISMSPAMRRKLKEYPDIPTENDFDRERLKWMVDMYKSTKSDRFAALRVAVLAFVEDHMIKKLSVEKRKAMLMEATVMACADGTVSDIEQALLMDFCEACNLDKELIEDFKDIAHEFTMIYSKSLELITE